MRGNKKTLEVDATASTNEFPEMQEVRHSAARKGRRTDELRANTPLGLVFTPLNRQVRTACFKNRVR